MLWDTAILCTGRNFPARATGGCCERETSNLISEEVSRSQYITWNTLQCGGRTAFACDFGGNCGVRNQLIAFCNQLILLL